MSGVTAVDDREAGAREPLPRALREGVHVGAQLLHDAGHSLLGARVAEEVLRPAGKAAQSLLGHVGGGEGDLVGPGAVLPAGLVRNRLLNAAVGGDHANRLRGGSHVPGLQLHVGGGVLNRLGPGLGDVVGRGDSVLRRLKASLRRLRLLLSRSHDGRELRHRLHDIGGRGAGGGEGGLDLVGNVLELCHGPGGQLGGLDGELERDGVVKGVVQRHAPVTPPLS